MLRGHSAGDTPVETSQYWIALCEFQNDFFPHDCPVPVRTLQLYQQRRLVAGLAIRFDRGARPKQKLLPHLSEARTAKFAVKHVKYNGHDPTPNLIIAVNSLLRHL
jgi:hypothetical protein